MATLANRLAYDGQIVLGRFLNHSKKHPNCELVKTIKSVPDSNGRMVILCNAIFRACRKIKVRPSCNTQ